MPACLLPGSACTRPVSRDGSAHCCSTSSAPAPPPRQAMRAASVDVHRAKGHRRARPPPSASSGTHLHALDAADTAPGFGPRGVLLVGLSAADAAAVQAWFHAMEPGFAVSHCSSDMLDGSVRQAVVDASSTPPSFRASPFTTRPEEKLPRLALFGGMAPQEVVAIAEHWSTFTNTADPVLVTLLPGMLDRALEEVVLEATRAAASARATGGRGGLGPDGDVERMDGAALKAAVRAKVEQRRAGRGRGPVQLDLSGGGGGGGGGGNGGGGGGRATLSRAEAVELGATGSVVVPAAPAGAAKQQEQVVTKGRRPKAATAKGFGKK